MKAQRVRSIVAPLALTVMLIAGSATAQQSPPASQGPTTAPAGGPDMDASQGMKPGQGMHHAGTRARNMAKDPASRAYMQSMRTMNQDMRGKPMTGDADRDFAQMMAPHHQGAIDMARVELQYGKDPDLKAMAQKLIDDQSKEIRQLQDWLKQHPAKPTDGR